MSEQDTSKPFQAGVFGSVEGAQAAVNSLLDAGFMPQQINVLCSDDSKESHFRQYEHATPAGTNTPASAAIGGAVGAALGGLGTAAASLATGMDAVALTGIGFWSGGVFGGFLGAMMSRGTENELSNYYNQAVQKGKILVAVEDHGADAEASLARAAAIFAEKGSESVPLTEG